MVPKAFRTGTHRTISPEQTVERVCQHLPLFGITRIANITGLDCIGVPVVMVSRPNARSLAVSQGKGLTLMAAKASGLMEAVESYHAERVHLPLKLASYNELRFTHNLVDLAGLPRLSVSSFHDHLRLLWIEGRDLLGDAPVWLPYEMVHTDYTLPLPTGSGSFFMSSNGLASGNHLLEAVSHGICEVVERDATTLWHALDEAGQRRTRIDLETVDDPGCREVLDQFARAGVMAAVWETTSDIGLPAFLCAIAESEEHPLRPLYWASGSGCHPAREVALLRALTEAAQSRVTLIAGARDDLGHALYREAQDEDARRRNLAQMRVAAGERLRHFHEVPTLASDTLDDDVAGELERLHAAGIRQVAVVDLTKPEFGIPVVRVVIPGLESLHDAPGYVPGVRAQRKAAERGVP